MIAAINLLGLALCTCSLSSVKTIHTINWKNKGCLSLWEFELEVLVIGYTFKEIKLHFRLVSCPDLTCPRLKSGSGDNATFRSAFMGRDCDDVRDNC